MLYIGPNVDESTDFGDVVVLSEEVERAVRELVVNKSCGIDGIYAEHMLYSSHVLFRLLALCMSSFLVHGVLPDEMMAVALVPIIKSKSGRIMSKDITIVPSLWLVLSARSWKKFY